MQQIIIDESTKGQRLNKLLGKYLNAAPQSFIYKMLRKKNIKLNHKRADGNEIVKAGDVIEIFMADDTICSFRKDGEIPAVMMNRDGMAVGISAAEMNKDVMIAGVPAVAMNKDCMTDESPAVTINKIELLPIIYEDEDVLILNKPVGELSQKARKEDYSLNEKIVDYYHQREGSNSLFTPSVCNRLDRNTSGILLAGMSLKGTQELSRMLKERELDKYYLTIVHGRVERPETVKGFLVKNESHNQVTIFDSRDEAITHGEEHPAFIETYYEPVAVSEFQGLCFSLLKVKLITGKTHQIRAHLDSVGHSIVGDGKYGLKSVNAVMKREFGLKNQLLHAYHLKFPEETGSLTNLSDRDFYAELPDMLCDIITGIFDKSILKRLK